MEYVKNLAHDLLLGTVITEVQGKGAVNLRFLYKFISFEMDFSINKK